MDFKTRFITSLCISFLLAMLVVGLLNPIVTWYLNTVPTMFSCGSIGWACDIPALMITVLVPIGSVFLCVWSVIEVFSK